MKTRFDGHTPGPWKSSGECHADNSYHIGPECEGQKTGIRVKENTCIEEVVADVWLDSPSSIPNRDLVSAAPDLLALAVELREALGGIAQQVSNGRLCYFGDHTGYQPQFNSAQVEAWQCALSHAAQLLDLVSSD